jgi:ribosomal-protein-alanine N-acetyltransferase
MIRIRPAQDADVPRLMEIAGHSVTAARWSEKEYMKIFSSDSGRSCALVIEEDGMAAGFLVGRQVAHDEWEIENVAIAGDARRRGLGSHLLGEFVDLVRNRGGERIYLEVRETNQGARRLYEKWAFNEAGRRKSYYQNPPEDALILELSFPQKNI